MLTLQPFRLPTHAKALAFKGSHSHSTQDPSDPMDWQAEQPQDSLDFSQQQKQKALETKVKAKFDTLLMKNPYTTDWDLKQAAGDLLLREPDHTLISSDHLTEIVRTAKAQAQANLKTLAQLKAQNGSRVEKRKHGPE